MLAKVPLKRGGHQRGGFEALLAYLTEDKSKEEDALDLVDYISREGKVRGIETVGLMSLKTAGKEMHDTALQNPRAVDPVYHFILSWPADEKPTNTEACAAAKHALKTLGMAGHQAVIAVHYDTDHVHVHVAVNRVHPETYKAVNLWRDHYRLDQAVREIELAQGWSHTNGPYQVVEVNGERHIVRRNDIKQARVLKRDPKKREAGRILRREARDALYARWRAGCGDALSTGLANKKSELAAQRVSEAERVAALRERMREVKARLYAGEHPQVPRRVLASLVALERARSRDVLKKTFAAERESLHARYKDLTNAHTWRAWITREAAEGDETARAVLRGFTYQDQRQRRLDERAGIKPIGEHTPTLPKGHDIQDLRWHITRHGVVSYRWQDGTEVFRDLGWQLLVNDRVADDAAIRVAVQLAAEKWGWSIRLTGDLDFKTRAAGIAQVLGIAVQNPELGPKPAHTHGQPLPGRTERRGLGEDLPPM